MAVPKAIVTALDALYLDRKGLAGNAGFDFASKAWDYVRGGRPEDHLNAWAFAVLAGTADPVAWGTFRALVGAWLLEETNGQFSFPRV
jgi:hypothetical protein